MASLDAPWLGRSADARRVSVEALRRRCAALPPPGRVWLLRGVAERHAGGLLLPVVEVDGEAALVVTKRPSTMRQNPGDWVFPGGRFDPQFDATTAETARREACEELGLAPERLETVGQLSTFGPTTTGYVLDVFVGLAEAADIRPDPREVAETAVVPISALAAPGAYRESADMPPFSPGPGAVAVEAGQRDPDRLFRFFAVRPGEELWGLQANILHELLSWVVS